MPEGSWAARAQSMPLCNPAPSTHIAVSDCPCNGTAGADGACVGRADRTSAGTLITSGAAAGLQGQWQGRAVENNIAALPFLQPIFGPVRLLEGQGIVAFKMRR